MIHTILGQPFLSQNENDPSLTSGIFLNRGFVPVRKNFARIFEGGKGLTSSRLSVYRRIILMVRVAWSHILTAGEVHATLTPNNMGFELLSTYFQHSTMVRTSDTRSTGCRCCCFHCGCFGGWRIPLPGPCETMRRWRHNFRAIRGIFRSCITWVSDGQNCHQWSCRTQIRLFCYLTRTYYYFYIYI